jgi:hypothetical protein
VATDTTSGYLAAVAVGLRQGRVAENEAFFRDVNERSLERRGRLARDRLGEGYIRFLCECSSDSCAQTLHLTLAEYTEIRKDPDRFFVIPGHEAEEAERVVELRGRYCVVEKRPDAVPKPRPARPGRGGRRDRRHVCRAHTRGT